MAQDHSNDPSLRRVTKPEACQILQVSLSTLNRRIAEGQLEVERVQQGQGHRVFVLMPADTDRPEGRMRPDRTQGRNWQLSWSASRTWRTW